MSNSTQALKDLYAQFNNGEIDKNEYERQKKFIILNMSGGQQPVNNNGSNNMSRTTSSSSKNPSRRQPVNPNINYNTTSNQNNVQMNNQQQEEQHEEQQEMNGGDNKPKAQLYGQVTKVTKNSINLNKYEKRDQNTNPIISRQSFDPNYGFGQERTGVADVDDLLDYLQKLDELLIDVETSHERYTRLQNELPSGVFVSKDPKNLKNEDSVPKKIRAGKILLYAEKNRVKKIEQYLDMGVSVNYQDHDTGNSPLITAAVYGQREALYFLVERGANVNLQNEYGDTALHELIKNRRENLAIWLIKHGADIFMENKRTFTPYDLALPWFQRDMKKIASGVDITQNYTVKENFQTSYTLHNSNDPNHDNGSSKVMKETPKPIKIYLKNQSYKNVMVTSTDNSSSVLVMMGEKMGLSKEQSDDLQLIEHIKGKERKLLGGEKILEVKRGWPLIVDQGAKIDPIHFRCEPKSTCRNDVREAYHKYINT